MDDKEKFQEIVKRTNKMLLDNPDLHREIGDYSDRIEEILDHRIEINLVYAGDDSDEYRETLSEYEAKEEEDYDEYNDIYNEYGEDELTYNNTLSVGEFLEFIEDEDREMNITIDPVYLKKGINEIKNLLITSVGNNLILVPKTNEDE